MIQIVGDSPEAKAGRAEIARLTWKANRYDELTLALAWLASAGESLHADDCEIMFIRVNGDKMPTPDSIAAAIIKAAREVEP